MKIFKVKRCKFLDVSNSWWVYLLLCSFYFAVAVENLHGPVLLITEHREPLNIPIRTNAKLLSSVIE